MVALEAPCSEVMYALPFLVPCPRAGLAHIFEEVMPEMGQDLFTLLWHEQDDN